MITKQELMADIAKLENDVKQAIANSSALNGALQYCKSLLARAEALEASVVSNFENKKTPVSDAVTAPTVKATNNETSTPNGTANS